ncbi:hypothetical protein KUCAC02_029352, partial [Chaenocephalus aceratus]
MQEELDTTPLLLTGEAFRSMHKATCQKCGAAIPLQLLTEHIKSCNISDENLAAVEDSREQGDAAFGEGVSRFFFSTCMDKLNSGFCINFVSDVRHTFVPSISSSLCVFKLEGESEISDEGKRSVRDLAFAWDLPCLTGNNRRWLFEKMLIHAVIGRVIRHIKQLRRGLKETPMWAMLSQRPDTVALLFPQEGAVDYSPAVILQRYLRRFIENASPDVMANLVIFWTGWEILSIEVVN